MSENAIARFSHESAMNKIQSGNCINELEENTESKKCENKISERRVKLNVIYLHVKA